MAELVFRYEVVVTYDSKSKMAKSKKAELSEFIANNLELALDRDLFDTEGLGITADPSVTIREIEE